MLGYFLSGPIAHQIILSHWYTKRRGRAMGIAYVGGALLGALGNKLNPWLVHVRARTRARSKSRAASCCWPGRWRSSSCATGLRTSARRRRPARRHRGRRADPDAAVRRPAPAAVVLAAAARQRGVDRLDRDGQLPDEVRVRGTGVHRPGGAQSDLEHGVVHGALRGDCGPSRRRPPGRSVAAAPADVRDLRARGRGDSAAVSGAPRATEASCTSSRSSSASRWAPTTC